LIPLEKVNSPDQEVYRTGKNGGFAYLFGQVNAVPVAFNTGSLKPLERLTSTMAAECPENLLLFVMLSTHDGRSVQGIGVDRPDGHVSIREFSQLKDVAASQGGKVKFRSVPPGTIPAGTFEKACGELDVEPDAFAAVFDSDGGEYKLRKQYDSRDDFIDDFKAAFSRATYSRAAHPGADAATAAGAPHSCDAGVDTVSDFIGDWVISGRTAYELCCTTRSAFDPAGLDGKPLTPVEEARRLALAQVFVLSFGQAVPAVYFNDLVGLQNDTAGYKRSGRPRDLNRHKSHADAIRDSLTKDEFAKTYVFCINRAIEARTADPAFHPKGRGYAYRSLTDTVFLNHAYCDGHHSFVVGNIDRQPTTARVNLSEIGAGEISGEMTDRLTGKQYVSADGVRDLEVTGYGSLCISAGRLK
jgi:hypothetical protein